MVPAFSKAMKEHRFQSEALPSNLAGQSIWSEAGLGACWELWWWSKWWKNSWNMYILEIYDHILWYVIYVRHGYCNIFFITDTITPTLTYYSRVLNGFHTVRDDTKSRVNLDHCSMPSRLAISAIEPNQPRIPSTYFCGFRFVRPTGRCASCSHHAFLRRPLGSKVMDGGCRNHQLGCLVLESTSTRITCPLMNWIYYRQNAHYQMPVFEYGITTLRHSYIAISTGIQ